MGGRRPATGPLIPRSVMLGDDLAPDAGSKIVQAFLNRYQRSA